eukprot:TRINITY_DN2228_c0_g5_i1.p1 TRINITY_DN2228_c0_g5~~TRINITY_DN2228_c0_g5_i1.p1  ORF type:complete len:122 (-),score=17.78 TRINITY_DN2228_c0_g5_i1:113-478(-)
MLYSLFGDSFALSLGSSPFGFFGSLLICILTRVLGGEITYSQTLGVIGYCLLPLLLTVIFLAVLPLPFWFEIFVKIVGTLWSSMSATSLLLISAELEKKLIMLLYPVFLLYTYFISVHSGV